MAARVKGNKYGRAAKIYRTNRDGDVFDSKKELARHEHLKLMQRAGMITDLERQPKYDLILPDGTPIKIGNRKCVYTPDFQYRPVAAGVRGDLVIEDFKGFFDSASKFRIAVFEAIFKVKVKIVSYDYENKTWVEK